MKRFVVAAPVLALALAGSGACATKKMVRQRVGEVNDKVETLSQSLEENQQRTKANEARIGEVDQHAQAADQKAQQAGQRADEAAAAADKVNTRADKIESRVEAHRLRSRPERRRGRVQVRPGEAPAGYGIELDELVNQLKANPNGAYIEIEGHTDNVGPQGYQLQNRARACRGREALPLRAAPDSAPQDQRDQLR